MKQRPKKNEILLPPGGKPDMQHEASARAQGFSRICGIDEAGRGPLAGPVVAAAVILPMGYELPGLNDSKKLTARRREQLYEALMEDNQVQKCVSSADVREIDELNILRATHLAMQRAALGLTPRPDFCLIDGLAVPGFPLKSLNLVKGDARSLSIAAASILAKVTRDRYMKELDALYPQYGFARHAGYGTKAHLQAIQQYGVTEHHRRSFTPVAQMELPLGF
ncbi:MAG: ribonuclease HII [Akkermansia sp.]|nr:ribonuclease HII [Akkermansia sp.]